MRAGVPGTSVNNLASRGLCLQEADALSAIAIVPVVRLLQLETGVTRRELRAALNDSLQFRLGPRWFRCVQERVHVSIQKCIGVSRDWANASLGIGRLLLVGDKKIGERGGSMKLLMPRVSQPGRHPERLSNLRERSMIPARATRSRLTLWTATALLAILGTLWALPQSGPRPHRYCPRPRHGESDLEPPRRRERGSLPCPPVRR